jgi:hypothetical protein
MSQKHSVAYNHDPDVFVVLAEIVLESVDGFVDFVSLLWILDTIHNEDNTRGGQRRHALMICAKALVFYILVYLPQRVAN